MIPMISIEDDNGNIFQFDETFWISAGNISNNTSVINYSYAPGGANVADGYIQSKIISLEGIIRADTPLEFENLKRAISTACLKGGKLRISDDIISRYIDVRFPSFSNGKEEGRLYQELTIDFVAQNPYWFDYYENVHTETISGNKTFTVDNSGSDFIIFPIFEFTSTGTGGLPGITLRNQSDGAAAFTYSDNQFQLGDILTINSQEGTVKLNNGNRIENFNPAVFLRLQPGSNIFVYEGEECTLKVKFRKSYLLVS